jgi:hypothetical protein
MQKEVINMIVRIEDVIDYLHGVVVAYPKPHHPMTREDTKKYLIYQAIGLANAVEAVNYSVALKIAQNIEHWLNCQTSTRGKFFRKRAG